MTTKRTQKEMDELLETIAQVHLGIGTLKTQNVDSLDFHDCSVESIKKALTMAYLFGVESHNLNLQKKINKG